MPNCVGDVLVLIADSYLRKAQIDGVQGLGKYCRLSVIYRSEFPELEFFKSDLAFFQLASVAQAAQSQEIIVLQTAFGLFGKPYPD